MRTVLPAGMPPVLVAEGVAVRVGVCDGTVAVCVGTVAVEVAVAVLVAVPGVWVTAVAVRVGVFVAVGPDTRVRYSPAIQPDPRLPMFT